MSATPGPELSIIVPTFNEVQNIPSLIELLRSSLADIRWEVVFVDDDSPDETWRVAKVIGCSDVRVRCVRRVGRRGLAGACIEGILASSSPLIAVMDADHQHDEKLLPLMYKAIQRGADLVVGSRYIPGGSSGHGLSSVRQWGSTLATKLARKFLRITLTDPMSGFFMIRREKVEDIATHLSRDGFKILLDIVASTKYPLKTIELPFRFRERNAGNSKLDSLVTIEFLGLLLSKLSGGLLPIRFLLFLAVGASGVFVHLGVLWFVTRNSTIGFALAQLTATVVAMTWNFILNNQLTYRDRRLVGVRFLLGLFTFYLVCSLGTLANVGAASWIYGFRPSTLLAGLAGALLGSVFNYAATSVITWKK